TITKATKTEWGNPTGFDVQDEANTAIHQRVIQLSTAVNTLRNKSEGWINHIAVRLAIFLVSVLAVLTLMLALLPTTKITIYPDPMPQKFTFHFVAKPNLETIRLSGEVPITPKTIHLKGTLSQKVTGKIGVPLSFATGEVLLTNLTDKEITIPAGTIVTTISIPTHRYQITQTTSLAAGSGKTLNVAIKAIIPGSSENIPKNAIRAVEGVLGLDITATNPIPISGGSDQTVTAVSARDQEILLSNLKQTLVQDAQQQLRQSLAKNDLILGKEPTAVSVINAVYNPGLNQPTDTVQLDLEIEATFAIASGEHIQQLAKQFLDTNLPVGYQSLDNEIQAHCLNPIQKSSNDSYSCNMEVVRQIIPKIDIDRIQQLIIFQSLPKAQQKIQALYPFHRAAQIEMNPSWWKILPALPMRILIEIKP
ncbi:MAG: baseplate J/gp47 family protein, partial [Anaerolineales bacterium]